MGKMDQLFDDMCSADLRTGEDSDPLPEPGIWVVFWREHCQWQKEFPNINAAESFISGGSGWGEIGTSYIVVDGKKV